MTRLVRIATLSCVAGVLMASAALANVPDPSKSTLGINLPLGTVRTYIQFGGLSAGLPDNCSDGRCMDYTVEVRDFANNPIAGSSVIADFSNCTPASGGDSRLNCTQPGFIAGAAVGLTTDAAGRVTFRIQGASNSTTGSLPSPQQSDGISSLEPPCARIFADGVLLGSLHAVHYDINGAGSPLTAVNSADASVTLNEVNRGGLSGIRYHRTNMDMNAVWNSADASRSLAMSNDQGLGTGSRDTRGPSATYCP